MRGLCAKAGGTDCCSTGLTGSLFRENRRQPSRADHGKGRNDWGWAPGGPESCDAVPKIRLPARRDPPVELFASASRYGETGLSAAAAHGGLTAATAL